jgi:uracil-DNA glycosylase
MLSTIDSSWNLLFEDYRIDLDLIYEDKKQIFPSNKKDVLKIFKMNVDDIKIIFLGQDPYYKNEFQAHGLSFSVPKDTKIPPSLKNIFKELQLEFPERKYNFKHGNLMKWFENEKIFLLNCSLTVEKSKPGSHMNIWKEFTDDVIRFINKKNKNCVYVFLGNTAQNKINLIDKEQHSYIITGVHPSPLSARRGFFNSNIFKNIEKILGYKIHWQN